MRAWATLDSPWAHLLDRNRFAQVLDGVRRAQPTTVLSSHLPPARRTSLESFLDVVASAPDAEPATAPSADELSHLLAAMAARGVPPG